MAEPTAPEAWRGLRALVVDDNATNRQILSETLRKWQMVPLCVEGGEQALAAAAATATESAPFDIVLLDVQMPGMDGFELASQLAAHGWTLNTAVLMLSSAANSSDAERCRQLGVGTYLVKPIRQADLLAALISVLDEYPREAPAAIAADSDTNLCPVSVTPRMVLLAEDNPVNQRVARALLEKRGHTVVVVENGREATEALATQQFDVVLMDLQMPVMDGLQATAAIRAMEQSTGRHTPIVAMTAHAMRGDDRRCLEAGMDAYLPKPVKAADLMSIIERLTRDEARVRRTLSNVARVNRMVRPVATEVVADAPPTVPPDTEQTPPSKAAASHSRR